MKNKFFILLAASSIPIAHADTYVDGRKIDLFSCEVEGRDLYGTALDDVPGKCTPIPRFKNSDNLLSITSDGRVALYIDRSSIVRTGTRLDFDMLAVVPDSSKAVYAGAQSAPAFDSRIHDVYDCAARTWTSNKVEVLRNVRTAPETVKVFIDDARPFRPAGKNSVPEIVLDNFCPKSPDGAQGAAGGAVDGSEGLRR